MRCGFRKKAIWLQSTLKRKRECKLCGNDWKFDNRMLWTSITKQTTWI